MLAGGDREFHQRRGKWAHLVVPQAPPLRSEEIRGHPLGSSSDGEGLKKNAPWALKLHIERGDCPKTGANSPFSWVSFWGAMRWVPLEPTPEKVSPEKQQKTPNCVQRISIL